MILTTLNEFSKYILGKSDNIALYLKSEKLFLSCNQIV